MAYLVANKRGVVVLPQGAWRSMELPGRKIGKPVCMGFKKRRENEFTPGQHQCLLYNCCWLAIVWFFLCIPV